MIQTVFHWLRQYPGLGNLRLEGLDAAPGSAGLFCRGQELLERREDILGKVTQRTRLRFTLSLHRAGSETPQELLTLARWAEVTAPVLGNDQTVSLEKGAMAKANAHGTARYDATITFTFTSEV